MNIFSIALVTFLLCPCPDQDPEQQEGPPPKAAITELHMSYINEEIMDIREAYQYFRAPHTYDYDTKYLIDRMDELRNTPRIVEAERFPNLSKINEYLAVNRTYHGELSARFSIDSVHKEELCAAMNETDELWRYWDKLREARSDSNYIWARRNALAELRDMLGHGRFDAGIMPSHIPTWYLPYSR